jgi:hypothetical protein
MDAGPLGGKMGTPGAAYQPLGFDMQPPNNCQSCRRSATETLLNYRKGTSVVKREGFLQCDVCERYACADCLQVYDIFSGYDFLCHECAKEFGTPPPGGRGH